MENSRKYYVCSNGRLHDREMKRMSELIITLTEMEIELRDMMINDPHKHCRHIPELLKITTETKMILRGIG